MILKLKIWLLLLPALFCNKVGAQTQTNDAGLWVAAQVNKYFLPRLGAQLGMEYRSKDHFKETDLFRPSLDIIYLVNNNISLDLGYYFYAKNTDYSYVYDHRILFQSVLKYTIEGFTGSWRPSFSGTFANSQIPIWAMRNRFKLEYYISHRVPLKPYIAYEIYNQFTDGFSHIKDRYYIGMAYEMTPNHKIDVYYLAEHYSNLGIIHNILGIAYEYTFR